MSVLETSLQICWAHDDTELMRYDIKDFNGSDAYFSNPLNSSLWEEIQSAIDSMVLQVKESDQAGKQGELIFNPVGTNFVLEEKLIPKGWKKIPLPGQYAFFGLGIDFGKMNICVEAQFSNYPFLLNNALRSEVLFRDKVPLIEGREMQALIIITKKKHFPSSNSTLHYEQACEHLQGLSTHKLFSMPVRLVGLDTNGDQNVDAQMTTYTASRYSREIRTQTNIKVNVVRARNPNGASKFKKI